MFTVSTEPCTQFKFSVFSILRMLLLTLLRKVHISRAWGCGRGNVIFPSFQKWVGMKENICRGFTFPKQKHIFPPHLRKIKGQGIGLLNEVSVGEVETLYLVALGNASINTEREIPGKSVLCTLRVYFHNTAFV